ncbi:MAG TPA: ribosome biogenesis GTPase YlqF [Agitococcus sp.]|nr:ribosome biogenesis GTPase YlqF [Agitococcus sp.]HMY82860.1 ribosome biogenesis GTPase YlqF [Agitococcus sp.]HNA21865.1 ribosome biogenesis GTPase YlqF [Agitococcus sp.]HNB20514.1 ribosome biogenesis GTPase YlqF [Agitococcus sp.]HNC03303.1 ribosome biogenesis GTPase YlqF [Agitococcus sp.]
MSINWFPGHMNKAIREIKEILPKVDLVIEVLDARLPYSSSNPVIAKFCSDKPSLKLLTKSDLADPIITEQWLAYFRQQSQTQALAITTEKPEQIRGLIGDIKQMLAGKEDKLGNLTALITGIPNVGKSTLINTLAGKQIAKAANEPAVTQGQQRIDLRNGLILIDSPGILWPKIENPKSGYRLALAGSIKNTAMNHEDVACFGAEFFLKQYPEFMKKRFKLEDLPSHEVEFLEIIGKQRGCLGSGGYVDFHKIATILLLEFRSAILGRISLETPEVAIAEQQEVERILAEKAAQKELEGQQKKKRKR